MASTPPDRDADGDLTCPECYDEVWDNRKKKRDGTFSPKSPDFTCKDKEGCGWAYWLEPPKGSKKKKRRSKKKQAKKGASSGGSLAVALYNAHQVARQLVVQLREDGFELMADEAMVPEFARMLFDAHVRSDRPLASPGGGKKKRKKKKKKKPPPPEEEPEEEYEYVPDDELPF